MDERVGQAARGQGLEPAGQARHERLERRAVVGGQLGGGPLDGRCDGGTQRRTAPVGRPRWVTRRPPSRRCRSATVGAKLRSGSAAPRHTGPRPGSPPSGDHGPSRPGSFGTGPAWSRSRISSFVGEERRHDRPSDPRRQRQREVAAQLDGFQLRALLGGAAASGGHGQPGRHPPRPRQAPVAGRAQDWRNGWVVNRQAGPRPPPPVRRPRTDRSRRRPGHARARPRAGAARSSQRRTTHARRERPARVRPPGVATGWAGRLPAPIHPVSDAGGRAHRRSLPAGTEEWGQPRRRLRLPRNPPPRR